MARIWAALVLSMVLGGRQAGILVEVMLRFSLLFTSALVSSFAMAQNTDALGKWTGKMVVTPGKTPDGKPIAMPNNAPKVVYELELKKDGSYFTTIKGAPDGKTHTSNGKWTRNGSKFTLTVQMRDGKPDTSEPKVRVLELSKDGKTLTTSMQGQLRVQAADGKGGEPPKGFVPPKITLVFTRRP